MTVVPTFPRNLEFKMEKLLEQFIWNGRKPKIKTTILQGRRVDGGLRLVNLCIKDRSLKAQWVSKLYKDDTTLTYLHFILLTQ